MRGSTVFQTHELYKEVDNLGTSKHSAKEVARENGASTWSEIGKELGVHSYGTADDYRDSWRRMVEYVKEEFGVKNMESLTGTHVAAYLQSKIEDGVAAKTFGGYASAMDKLETALTRYAESHNTGRTYDFSKEMDAVRTEAKNAKLSRPEGSRAYSDPKGLIEAVKDSKFALVATIQLESGSRISEASDIKASQLKGLTTDKVTGEEKGQLVTSGKGGKITMVYVSPATYARTEAAITEAGGRFRVDRASVRAALKEAAAITGQKFNSTHGLRWNYAQERMSELQVHGKSYDQALAQVSKEMKHNRLDITLHYQK